MNTQKQISEVLHCEADAIKHAATLLDQAVDAAVDLLHRCSGRVIVSGMGKMGCIARKAAATFCSTGTPAVFLHPAEAVHGDLGIVTENDVLIVLSNSGETREVLELLPHAARLNVPSISVTAKSDCSLAKRCTAALLTGVTQEADSIAVAPTNSTTVTLAMCDALAIALMDRRGFTREQFAIFHPGGHLGNKLLTKVSDVMGDLSRLPSVVATDTLATAIATISNKGMGATFVVDAEQKVLGVLTDGDLRRIIEQSANDLATAMSGPIERLMTRNPKTTSADALAASAMKLMEDNGISVLPVVDATGRLAGIVHLHDLIRSGLA